MSVDAISDLDSISTEPREFSDPLVTRVHAVAHTLCQGLNTIFDWMLHTWCTPIRPGEFDNLDTYGKELAARTAAVALSLLLLLPCLALTLIGQAMHATADLLSGKDYLHLAGNCASQPSPATFFTHNACMFGPWSQIFGGASTGNERIEQEAQLICRLNPDVICLQEIEFAAARKLSEKLKDNYAHAFLRIGPNPPTMESCLFFATKAPILQAEFVALESLQSGIRRGFFYVETETCVVFTTHLDPHDEPIHQECRRRQLGAILAAMKTFDKPCFLLGDLNIVRTGEENDEYSRSGIPAEFIDPYPDLTPTCTDYFNQARTGRSDRQYNWELNDYTLARGVALEALTVRTIEESINIQNPSSTLSDHKALLLTWHP